MKKTIIGLALAFVCVFAAQAKAEESAIKSNDALAYINIDIDRTPGWIAEIEAGYQWNIFKNAGFSYAGTNHVTERNHTKGGAAASISLGYNFSPRFPLTLGLKFGVGPGGKLETSKEVDTDLVLSTRQRISIYTLDLSADYEFKNCSRWTPFLGVTGGVARIGNKASARIYDTGVFDEGARYGKKHTYNFVVGARAGVKYDINQCVSLSLYGSYNYLGKIKSKELDFPTYGGIRTTKITVHSLAVTAGLKVAF